MIEWTKTDPDPIHALLYPVATGAPQTPDPVGDAADRWYERYVAVKAQLATVTIQRDIWEQTSRRQARRIKAQGDLLAGLVVAIFVLLLIVGARWLGGL